jgi:uncharacterized protein
LKSTLNRERLIATTLITGASSGIGLELVKQFAAGGDDLVLTARREDRLLRLAVELQRVYRVSAIAIPSDLAKADGVDQLCEYLGKRDIRVDTLVNNAGFGALGRFAELSNDRQRDMLMVNVIALTRLTRSLLPEMIQRKSGGMLNVGSVAAYQAGPNMAVYYASKAYVLSFTEELIGSGLHVTCLEPGATESGFGDDSGMGNLKAFRSQTMSSATVAKAGYEGYRRNVDVVVLGWRNRLIVAGVGFLPRFVSRKIVGKMQMKRSQPS